MNKVIWKYSLQVTDEQVIDMPKGASLLTVQVQGEMACLWAIVEPSMPMEKRTFVVVGTGHEKDFDFFDVLTYIGTFQMVQGAFIGHVFERRSHDCP